MANIWEKLNNFVVKEGKHETEETSVTQNSSTKNVGNSEDQIPTADQVSVNETENKHGRNSSVRTVDQFVIPKRKICESELLLASKEDSREYQHDILQNIVQSYRKDQSNLFYKYSKPYLVQNKKLEQEFFDKKKEFRKAGYSDKEIKESFGFLYVDEEQEVEKLCRNGITVSNLKSSSLGRADMGVQLCKHADIIKPSKVTSRFQGYLVIFKIIKGKVKQVTENYTNIPLEPTPNFDCHVAINSDPKCAVKLFNSSQIYIYEYGEENVVERPRQTVPFAVVKLSYIQVSKPVDSKTQSEGSSFGPKQRQSLLKPLPGPIEEEEEFVIWNGPLTIKGKYACYVNMVSSATLFKPVKLGKGINITHKLNAGMAKQKYLKTIGKLRKKNEDHCGNYYVNVCELRPNKPDGKSHFEKMMYYLGKHDCVAVQKIEKDVILLLLTQGELSYQLGLTRPHQYPIVLYCLFLSKHSRSKRLSGDEHDKKKHLYDDKSTAIYIGDKTEEADLRRENSDCDKSKDNVVTDHHNSAIIITVNINEGLVPKDEASTACDTELRDTEDDKIAVIPPLLQSYSPTKSSPCDTPTKSHGSCTESPLFESPIYTGPNLCIKDNFSPPKLDRISPNVNPEILVLPPDLPYRKRSTTRDNYLIEEDLKTWSRTSDDYVMAVLYDERQEQTIQRKTKFVLPPTPGTPIVDEQRLREKLSGKFPSTTICPNSIENGSKNFSKKDLSDSILNTASSHLPGLSDLEDSSSDQEIGGKDHKQSISTPNEMDIVLCSSLGVTPLPPSPSDLDLAVQKVTTKEQCPPVPVDPHPQIPPLSALSSPQTEQSDILFPQKLLPQDSLLPPKATSDSLHSSLCHTDVVQNLKTNISLIKSPKGTQIFQDSNIPLIKSPKGTQISEDSNIPLIKSPKGTQISEDSNISLIKSPKGTQISEDTNIPLIKSPKGTQISEDSNIPLIKSPKGTPISEDTNIPLIKSPKGTQISEDSNIPLIKSPKGTQISEDSNIPLIKSPKGTQISEDSNIPFDSSPSQTSIASFQPTISKASAAVIQQTEIKVDPSENTEFKRTYVNKTLPKSSSLHEIQNTLGHTADYESVSITVENLHPLADAPLIFRSTATSPNVSHSISPIRTSPVLPSVNQLAFQASIPSLVNSSPQLPSCVMHRQNQNLNSSSRSPYQMCGPSYGMFISTPVGYRGYPVRPVPFHGPRMPVLQWDEARSSPRPVNCGQQRPLLDITPPFVSVNQPYHQRSSVPLLSSYNTIVPGFTLNPAPTFTDRINPQQMPRPSVMNTHREHDKKSTTSQKISVSQISTKNPTSVMSIKPLVPYSDIAEVVRTRPLVPYSDTITQGDAGMEIKHLLENTKSKDVLHVVDASMSSYGDIPELVEDRKPKDGVAVIKETVNSKEVQNSSKEVIDLNKLYEEGFKSSPPKSSFITLNKLKSDFKVQEKAHELHKILRTSPKAIHVHQNSCKFDASSLDFAEEVEIKTEMDDYTIDNMIQFLDFDARSDHVQFNHGNEVVKYLTNVRSVNETIENTLPKNNICSTNEGMKARRHNFDNTIFSEMSPSKLTKGGLKHHLNENSSEEFVACKKIKLDVEKDKLQTKHLVQIVERETTDSSDLELIGSKPPPIFDLTSPVIDLTTTPSPIRIVKTVTGYKVEKTNRRQSTDKTNLEVKSDLFKKSNLEEKCKIESISNDKNRSITNNENNKSKAKTSSIKIKKLKSPQKILSKPEITNEKSTGKSKTEFMSTEKSISKQESVPKSMSKQESVPKSILKQESVPKSILKQESVPKSMSKQESLPKSMSKQESVPKSMSKQESVPKSMSKQESLPKNMSKQESLPKSMSKRESLPKNMSKQESLSTEKNQTKDKITSKSNPESRLKCKVISDGKTIGRANNTEKSGAKNMEEKLIVVCDSECKANVRSNEMMKTGEKQDKVLNCFEGNYQKLDKLKKKDKPKINIKLKYKISSNDKISSNVENLEKPAASKSVITDHEKSKGRSKYDEKLQNCEDRNRSKSISESGKSLKSDEKHKRKNEKHSERNSCKDENQQKKDKELLKKTRWDMVMKALDIDTTSRISRSGKRKDSESDSDARSRNGLPHVMYISDKKSKIKRSSPSKKAKASRSPGKQISVYDCGIPHKELGSFKIPKMTSKTKDEKKSSNYSSSKKREEYRTSKTKKDEKERSHKSETNKDATRKSRSDKDSGRDSYHRSQKSSKNREKDDKKKGETRSNSEKEKCKKRIEENKLDHKSKRVSDIMNLIEGQLKRTKEKQDVEMTSGYIPSDSVSDCRSEKTEDSTDHMQDLLDVMNGEVPLEVIDEIGTDKDSLKDNSTLNMSDDYAKDLNCAIPVYGSRTKHLSGDSKKSISSPKVNIAETIEETCQNGDKNVECNNVIINGLENTHEKDVNDNLVNSTSPNVLGTPISENCLTATNSNTCSFTTASTNLVGVARPIVIVDPLDFEEHFVPTVDRKVEEVDHGKQMRITVKNDCPLQKSVIGYSQVELIKTCLHGKLVDMKILSLQESVINKSVTLTLHKLNIASSVQRHVNTNGIAPVSSTDTETKPTITIPKEENIIPGLGDLHLLEEASQTPFSEANNEKEAIPNIVHTDEEAGKSHLVISFGDSAEVKDSKPTIKEMGNCGDSKIVENLKLEASEKMLEISPIKGPEIKKKEKLIEQHRENSCRGPIRSSTAKSNRQDRQHHPYHRKEKHYKSGWSFDIDYTFEEIMQDLSTSLYKACNKKTTPKTNKPRFSSYRFRRSAVPEFLPDDRDELDLTREAIPDFDERKKKAELLDTLTSTTGEEEPFTAEQTVYDRDVEPLREEFKLSGSTAITSEQTQYSGGEDEGFIGTDSANIQNEWENRVNDFLGKCETKRRKCETRRRKDGRKRSKCKKI